jgi:hypothetical protein
MTHQAVTYKPRINKLKSVVNYAPSSSFSTAIVQSLNNNECFGENERIKCGFLSKLGISDIEARSDRRKRKTEELKPEDIST